MATGEQYQLTFAEQQNKKDEEIQDSLQEGKIEAREKNLKTNETLQNLSLKQRLNTLQSTVKNNDKNIIINSNVVEKIDENNYSVSFGELGQYNAHFDKSGHFLQVQNHNNAKNIPLYVSINHKNEIISIMHFKTIDAYLYIDNDNIYEKTKTGIAKKLPNNIFTDKNDKKYQITITNKNGQSVISSKIIPTKKIQQTPNSSKIILQLDNGEKIVEFDNKYYVKDARGELSILPQLHDETYLYYTQQKVYKFSVNSGGKLIQIEKNKKPKKRETEEVKKNNETLNETLNENLENLTEGKIKSHQYEIEQLLRNGSKDTLAALAKILKVDLRKVAKVTFAKHVQKTIGLKGSGSKGIDGLIGNYTLKKIWERKLNDKLDGKSEEIRVKVDKAVKKFSDYQKFKDSMTYTARTVEKAEENNVIAWAKKSLKSDGTPRFNILIKNANKGQKSLLLDSRTKNLYVVEANNDGGVTLSMAVKTSIGQKINKQSVLDPNFYINKYGTSKIHATRQPDGSFKEGGTDTVSKWQFHFTNTFVKGHATPAGYHYFHETIGIKNKTLTKIVSFKDKKTNGQYPKGKGHENTLSIPRNKKPSMITLRMGFDASGLAGHGSDKISSITALGTNNSSGCIRILPADIATLSAYNNDIRYTGILIV